METRALLPTFGRRGIFAPLANLRGEMDKLFNEWLKDFEPLRMVEGEHGYAPYVDLRETETALEVIAELPGVEEKDFTIELTRDALLFFGEKKLPIQEEKTAGYQRRERYFGSFYRAIPLPWEVDIAKAQIVATFVNGVLTIKVPKPTNPLRPSRKIAING